MADERQLEILRSGVEAWNRWREENPLVRTDLSSADLTGADLPGADLRATNLSSTSLQDTYLAEADLFAANLSHADLLRANLQSSELSHANLQDAKLSYANLEGAELSHANLQGAELLDTRLTGANLMSANLMSTNLSGADLTGADLREAFLSRTVFDFCDLSTATGLEETFHVAASTVGFECLKLTAASLSRASTIRGTIETFLLGAGAPEEIMDAFSLMIASPIEFYSCFISYSHSNKPFARRLYDQLQGRGIRCWLDEKDIKPGERILDVVNDAIRLHQKLLLCCSRASLESWWVRDEIRKAQERERKEGRLIIVPLDLDGYLFEWKDGLASDLTSRLAPRFTGWESDNDKFEERFERVVQALKTERPQ